MRENLRVYREILSLLKQYPRLVAALLGTSLLGIFTEGLGLGLILPLLQPDLVNHFFSQLPLLAPIEAGLQELTLVERVRLAACLLVAIMLVRNVLVVASRFVSLRLQEQIEYDLKMQTMRQIHAAELRYIYQQQAGGLLTTLTRHTWQATWLMNYATGAVADGFALFVYAGFMLLLSWQLTLIAALLLGAVLVLNYALFHSPLRRLGESEAKTDRAVHIVAVESLAAMKLLHLFRKEQTNIEHYDQVLQQSQRVVYAGKRLTALLMPIFSFLAVFVLSTLLLVTTFLLPGQLEMWLGRLVIFLGIIFRLMAPASKLHYTSGQIRRLAPAFQAVIDFLRHDDKPFLQDGTVPFVQLQQEITLEGVDFRYATAETAILHQVSFTIPRGKMTALVGPSGAGKTTIANLVARLHDCDGGRIAVDGVDVRNLTLDSWRGALAVVSQDTFLFNDTVWNNLRFVKPDATDAEIVRAARLAQAHGFIVTLPQGYATLLGDRGVRLSGGQQQRLSIARAILADPQLLILDEATSELDSETERALQRAIEDFGRHRTLLVIAHRLSTIRAADQIIVLEGGRVVEAGTHQILVASGGLYRHLVQAQRLEGGMESSQFGLGNQQQGGPVHCCKNWDIAR